jgi:hypothetical protein
LDSFQKRGRVREKENAPKETEREPGKTTKGPKTKTIVKKWDEREREVSHDRERVSFSAANKKANHVHSIV